MNKRQFPLIAVALFVSGCAGPLAVSGKGGQGSSQFTTDVVKRQNLTGYSFFDGKLVIPKSAQAGAFSPYSTSVVSVMSGTGKYVRRGQPIVKLTIPGADEAAAAAKAGVSSAQADYSTQKGDSSDPVREARQTLADAQVAEKAARDTVAGGGQADVDGATQDRVDAQAALRLAQHDLRTTLQPDKDAVRLASASLKDARADAAKGIVRAPITATVVSFQAEPGMTANSSQTLATIVNFGAARVQGLVPAELKDVVVKHSHVIVAMNGPSSEPLDGTVLDIRVMPPTEGQDGPGYLAVIQFLSPRSIGQGGFSVRRIGVKTGMVKDALVVPIGAIVTKDGKTSVSVKNGDNWVATQVEIGISDGARVEIKSGLTEGAVIRVATDAQDIPQR
jgi:biotin carboxyl carrier protein